MIAKSPTKSFFRAFKKDTLKKMFKQAGIDLGIDWASRKGSGVAAIAMKWLDHMESHKDDANVMDLYEVFQQILVLMKARIDTDTVIENAAKAGAFSQPLPADYFKRTKAEQGAHIYLTEGLYGPGKLRQIADVVYARDLDLTQDQFVVYEAEPGALADLDNKDAMLAGVLDEFFLKRRKGGNCRVERCETPDADYFFATLDDAKEYIDMKGPSEPDFTLKEVIRPYEVIVVFDPTSGRLGIHTPERLGRKTDELAEKILNVLFGKAEASRLAKAEFMLDCFGKLDFEFPAMPNQGVAGIRATRIGIRPGDNSGNEIVIRNTRKGNAYRSFAETICWIRDNQALPADYKAVDFPNAFAVTQIGIRIAMQDGSEINFSITPKGCTHPGAASEEKRKVAEALIEKLGLGRK